MADEFTGFAEDLLKSEREGIEYEFVKTMTREDREAYLRGRQRQLSIWRLRLDFVKGIEEGATLQKRRSEILRLKV